MLGRKQLTYMYGTTPQCSDSDIKYGGDHSVDDHELDHREGVRAKCTYSHQNVLQANDTKSMSKTGIPPTTALADSLDHPSIVTENVPAVLKENALFKPCKQKTFEE